LIRYNGQTAGETPMDVGGEVLGSLAGVEVRRFRWTTLDEVVYEEPEAVLILKLGTPPGSETRALIRGSKVPFRAAGRVSFTPAHVPLAVHGNLGEVTVAVCRITPFLEGPLAQALQPNDTLLDRCHNIMGTQIGDILARMVHEVRYPGFASDIFVEAAATQAAVELARFFEASYRPPTLRTGRLSARQLTLINELIHEVDQVELSAIASRCNLSVRSLTRNYRATTGHTIGDLVADVRVGRAKHLLADCTLPIKLVAHRVGFSRVSAFSTAFRRATGVTPTAFRRSITG
jgi:AraC family transcriptional regulator